MRKERASAVKAPVLEMEIRLRRSNRGKATLRKGADWDALASFFEEAGIGSRLVLWDSPRPSRLTRAQAKRWVEPFRKAMSSALIQRRHLTLKFTVVIRPNGSGVVIFRQENTKKALSIEDLHCNDARDIPPVFRLLWAEWQLHVRPLGDQSRAHASPNGSEAKSVRGAEPPTVPHDTAALSSGNAELKRARSLQDRIRRDIDRVDKLPRRRKLTPYKQRLAALADELWELQKRFDAGLHRVLDVTDPGYLTLDQFRSRVRSIDRRRARTMETARHVAGTEIRPSIDAMWRKVPGSYGTGKRR